MRGRFLLFLVVSVALLALASPVVKWLITNGGDTGLIRPNSISFCNVLFIGNLCAGLLSLALLGPRRIANGLRGLDRRGWALLIVSVALAVIIPTLVFTALQSTMVTSLVLLGRLEAVSYAVLSYFVARAVVTRAQWVGYGVIGAGVVTIVLVQGGFTPMAGDGLIILAALLTGAAAMLSKLLLRMCPVATLVFVRNFASAITFFVVAVWAYGFGHFADAFAPSLWGAMLVYALVIVVLGQFLWYRALDQLPATTVANWSMLAPVLGVLFAYLLLGEIPNAAHWLGGVIIVAGMAVSRLGTSPTPGSDYTVEKTLAAG